VAQSDGQKQFLKIAIDMAQVVAACSDWLARAKHPVGDC
jgi:hypothetical protein